MLRHGQYTEANLKKRKAILDLINVAKDLIMAEQSMNLTNHVYRTRKYATHTAKTFVPMPAHITGEDDLFNLFSPLQDYIQELSGTHTCTSRELIQSKNNTSYSQESVLKEQVTQIGAMVSIRWSASEVGIRAGNQDGTRGKFMDIVKRVIY